MGRTKVGITSGTPKRACQLVRKKPRYLKKPKTPSRHTSSPTSSALRVDLRSVALILSAKNQLTRVSSRSRTRNLGPPQA